MKTTTQKTLRSLYGLCLLLLVYACTNETAEPLNPFTYNEISKLLKNLSMPGLRQSAVIPVSVTASTSTASSQDASLDNALANVPSGGGITPVISQAVTDINNAMAAAGTNANALTASFTPPILATLTGQNTLPTGLQLTVNAINGNGAITPYLYTSTYPQVNGNTITPTTTTIPQPAIITSMVEAVRVAPVNYAGPDACFKNANDTFDQTTAGLETGRQGQVNTVNSTYNTDKSAIESDLPSCVTGKLSTFGSLITMARQQLADDFQRLSAARTQLGESSYASLSALMYVKYVQQVDLYFRLQTAEVNVCTIVKETQLTAARNTRDTDLNTVNANFNITIKQAQAYVLQLFDACHNQGSGGNQ